jgi:hypothetical protein
LHIRYGVKSRLARLCSKSTFSTGFLMAGATKRTQPLHPDNKDQHAGRSQSDGISYT